MEITQKLLWEYFYYHVDGYLVWRKVSKYSPQLLGKRVGYRGDEGYIQVSFFGKSYKEHRLIFLYMNGYLPEELDHINRDRTDNKIENLREATHQQNQRNMTKQNGCKSDFIGVSWHKGNRKWLARISLKKGKQTHLGCFTNEKDAALAYNKAAEERDKAFKNLNKLG